MAHALFPDTVSAAERFMRGGEMPARDMNVVVDKLVAKRSSSRHNLVAEPLLPQDARSKLDRMKIASAWHWHNRRSYMMQPTNIVCIKYNMFTL